MLSWVKKTKIFYSILSFLIISLSGCQNKADISNPDYRTWSSYLGDNGRTHFSSLAQVDIENVSQLEVAWTYHSGDYREDNRSQIQCSPLVVDNILYGTNPALKLFALNAATGEELWKFSPDELLAPWLGVNRGLVFWDDQQNGRVLYSSGRYLYAVDAKEGVLIDSFGESGKVDLRWGLGKDPELMFAISNTPGVVYKDLLIMGTRVHESPGASPGHIRAYNLNTGEIAWTFHTIPQEGEFGTDTWQDEAWRYMGGANSWSGMSLDEEEGMVFIPTGSAAFDFYGGNRKGENLFANCLIALNAGTGERIWHFQFVHHDLWDRDLPAPPNLVMVKKGMKKIKAVAQVTKSGHVFVFDRLTGEPIFPIEEKPFPPSDLEGEEAWPTQPIPTKPPAFARQEFTEDMINDMFPDSKAKLADLVTSEELGGSKTLLEQFRMHKSGGQFVPVSEQGNIFIPGFDGGAEWGGAGYDPESGWLYVNSNEMPWIYSAKRLEDIEGNSILSFGNRLYGQLCARCHGAGLEGQQEGNIPSLANVGERLSRDSIKHQMFYGGGQMLPFSNLSDPEVEAIISFLLNDTTTTIEMDELTRKNPVYVPYTLSSFGRFLDDKGYPAIKPPWGTLNAIDLSKGEIVWQVPLGEFKELTEMGIPITGTENYGGPVITAGGLIFIAATKDEKFRAFDKKTGQMIWETSLPAGGYATPITYEQNGRQFIVISCGGGKMGTASGDAYVAFALP